MDEALSSKFVKVSVVLSAKEYDDLFHDACFTGPGTLSAAIRQRLGWQPTPYGFVKWQREVDTSNLPE